MGVIRELVTTEVRHGDGKRALGKVGGGQKCLCQEKQLPDFDISWAKLFLL
jgi:hypothetical protein